MRLSDIVILSLSFVFAIIGIDQILTLGFGQGYWAIMLALVLFFVYTLRKAKK